MPRKAAGRRHPGFKQKRDAALLLHAVEPEGAADGVDHVVWAAEAVRVNRQQQNSGGERRRRHRSQPPGQSGPAMKEANPPKQRRQRRNRSEKHHGPDPEAGKRVTGRIGENSGAGERQRDGYRRQGE